MTFKQRNNNNVRGPRKMVRVSFGGRFFREQNSLSFSGVCRETTASTRECVKRDHERLEIQLQRRYRCQQKSKLFAEQHVILLGQRRHFWPKRVHFLRCAIACAAKTRRCNMALCHFCARQDCTTRNFAWHSVGTEEVAPSWQRWHLRFLAAQPMAQR